MKPRPRDYLTILVALLVIFLCGAGVGFLVGEKNGRSQSQNPPLPRGKENGDWTERTVSRLANSLALTDEQRATIRQDVEQTAQKIEKSRSEAIGNYYRHLLQLHDDILPRLDPSQQEKIEKDREKLQRLLDSRF